MFAENFNVESNFREVNLIQGSMKWLNFRKNKVSSTIAPSFYLEKDKYGMSFKDHVLIARNEKKPKEYNNDYIFEKGHETENLARIEINKSGFNFTPAVVQDLENEYLIASLDGIDYSKATIFEHKMVGDESFKLFKNNIISDHFIAQIQWQLMITRFEKCILVCTNFKTGEITANEILADKNIQGKLRFKAGEFITYIQGAPLPKTWLKFKEFDKNEILKSDIESLSKLLKTAKEHDNEIKMLKMRIEHELENLDYESDEISIKKLERKGSISASKLIKHFDLDKNEAENLRGKSSLYYKYSLK